MLYRFGSFAASALALASAADAMVGAPTPGGLSLQAPATRIAERLHFFDSFLLWIITSIVVFVTALLIYVMFRYNRRANPEARKFSHNTTIEVVWTAVPVLILVIIALPSFTNLFYIAQEPDLEEIAQSGDFDDPNVYPAAAELGWITIKAQGNQWNWTYEYMDELDEEGYPLSFVSNPVHKGVSTDEADYIRNTGRSDFADRPKNLATDYPMVIPVDRYIRYQTIAADVIHSWTVPAFGIKTDAIPGKLNQGWFLVEEKGVFYGQCSEICGVNHAFMPIEVRVVSQEAYDAWVASMREGDFEGAVQIVDAELNALATQFADTQTLGER
ncbi:MAG: cytochrome c oxidase subunit II [Pseudomonadota bacterium]